MYLTVAINMDIQRIRTIAKSKFEICFDDFSENLPKVNEEGTKKIPI